jgi:predicted nucleotide-binding protein
MGMVCRIVDGTGTRGENILSIGVKVRDWQIDFRLASVILDEIEQAAKSCLGGIFLFTADDDLAKGDESHAAPRDNVVFEAGHFMHAVGRERTLIIREAGTKMPADVGGGIYLPLADRNDSSTIESDLRRFIET